MNRIVKRAGFGLLMGTLFQLGGCGSLVQQIAVSSAVEFLFDNDVVFDLFGDDAPGLVTQ